MNKIINGIEKFFDNAEKFFNNVIFIPRLLNAFKKGLNAFNDELFGHTKERQRLISERLKEDKKDEKIDENKVES